VLAADDERLMAAHVEDRDHRVAAQWVGLTYLGYAIHAPAARPKPEDSLSARQAAELELDVAAQFAVDVLDSAVAAVDAGDEERCHVRLQSACASIVAQRLAERRRLNPRLELADPLRVPRRLAMHRVLKPLYERFEVLDARFQRAQLIVFALNWGRLFRFLSPPGNAADLTDPSY
jgi:hypothetical protein